MEEEEEKQDRSGEDVEEVGSNIAPLFVAKAAEDEAKREEDEAKRAEMMEKKKAREQAALERKAQARERRAREPRTKKQKKSLMHKVDISLFSFLLCSYNTYFLSITASKEGYEDRKRNPFAMHSLLCARKLFRRA